MLRVRSGAVACLHKKFIYLIPVVVVHLSVLISLSAARPTSIDCNRVGRFILAVDFPFRGNLFCVFWGGSLGRGANEECGRVRPVTVVKFRGAWWVG